MNLVTVSSKVLGNAGIEQLDYQGQALNLSSLVRAIMECLLLSPSRYDLMDVYYLMEMLSFLRVSFVQQLLEECTSVKVKRAFL